MSSVVLVTECVSVDLIMCLCTLIVGMNVCFITLYFSVSVSLVVFCFFFFVEIKNFFFIAVCMSSSYYFLTDRKPKKKKKIRKYSVCVCGYRNTHVECAVFCLWCIHNVAHKIHRQFTLKTVFFHLPKKQWNLPNGSISPIVSTADALCNEKCWNNFKSCA